MLPERLRLFARLPWVRVAIFSGLVLLVIALGEVPAMAQIPALSWGMPWWACALLLFIVSFLIGIFGILGGVGGGVLFVPIVAALFPFHLDFVRGGGLLVALTGALAAGPSLLRSGIAQLRLALPPALVASVGAIVGANIGFILPENMLQLALGVIVIGLAVVMAFGRKTDNPEVAKPDALSTAFGMHGVYYDPFSGRHIKKWHACRTCTGLALFVLIGMSGGMFGIGAGWANVPVLNLVMGVPLKISIGTSSLVLSIASTAAAWTYLSHGAMLALIAVPSTLGMMLGAPIGVRLLARANVAVVRKILIVLLLLAGARALLKGLGA